MAIYALVVSRVAGPTIINRFTALSPFQRFEYGFQLVDGAGVAIIVTSPVWLLAHRFQNSSLQVLSASVIAVATYLALFISHTPVTFTWAVHGIPLGGARPFWPITGGMLLCSAAAMIVALPIVSGKRILARQSVIRK